MKMKLTDVIGIWDILHTRDVGELGYCDLEKAVEAVVGVEDDISSCRPSYKRSQQQKEPEACLR